jgi:23S rRNA (uracil1939-C5)-methyltransferase
MSHLGYAVGRINGKAVFASYALPDEMVEVALARERQDYSVGVTERVVRASPDRVAPPCPYFRPDGCGGCQWQHGGYEAQLRFKAAIVADQFRRIGRLPSAEVRPVIPSPLPYAYRTHATFSVDDQGALCFVAPDGAMLQPIARCLILRPELQELLAGFTGVDFRGVTRARLQAGSDPAHRTVILTGEPASIEPIVAALDGASLLVQRGEQTRTIRGRDWLTYTIHGQTFRASAGGFFQVNLAQAETLVQLMQDYAPDSVGHALDLYAGVGLFTAFLARRAQSVLSIEEYAPAVRDARQNLAAFGNVDVRRGSVEHALKHVEDPIDVVVTDPPRAGMKAEAINHLLRLRPRRILYVSCDPSTLARDARSLTTGGYNLDFVQPVDMFPQTHHIECVAVFTLDQVSEYRAGR